jgi:NitT/TauT family transport system substrate-binding protein
LKWLPDAQFAGYFVAPANGLYRDAGLDVTIKPGGPDITPAEIMGSGGADIAVDRLSAAPPAREQGVPLVSIAQIFQRSGMELIYEHRHQEAGEARSRLIARFAFLGSGSALRAAPE